MSFQQSDLISMQTLREAITQDPLHGVYVVNTARIRVHGDSYAAAGIDTPYKTTSMEAAININIGTAKEPMMINIPPLSIPFDLSAYGEPTDILKSPGFKDAIDKRLLTLISKVAYETIMDTPDAQEVKQHYESTRSLSASANLDDTAIIEQMNAKANFNPNGTPKRKLNSAKANTKEAKVPSLSPVIYKFTTKTEDMNHNTLYQEYKSCEPKLNEQDFIYLKEHAVVAKVQAAATKALDKLTATS